MLEPTRVKFRRVHRGNRRGMAKGGTEVNFGSYGLKAMEPGWITARQIEASRVAISRFVRKVGKMWIRIFPDKPITKKPLETRMGKGKGAPEYWVSNVKPGRILFEVEGIPRDVAHKAFKNAGSKLPIKTKLVARRGLDESK
ncbi:MAG: 50S ribosomal protein L16 [Candidatus Neomarinimicrobiota bacterium]|jgi:large subunit ribosomal protein L16|nr:50S ribosomal protein L16 [SAR86 cluster bacterium]GIT09983.1 MAG: 50S ribosomal protein L16 [Candidatus Neomarinimicrobiota bacterium]